MTPSDRSPTEPAAPAPTSTMEATQSHAHEGASLAGVEPALSLGSELTTQSALAESVGTSPTGSSTMEAEKLMALLAEIAADFEFDARSFSGSEAYRGECFRNVQSVKELAAALPSLLQAQTRVEELEAARDSNLQRCQKCGQQGLPSPTVVLDLNADLDEARAERDELRARLDALYKNGPRCEDLCVGVRQHQERIAASYRETVAKVEALPGYSLAFDRTHAYMDREEPPDHAEYLERGSVLEILNGKHSNEMP